MTIGKRKGAAAKGTGASPGNVADSKFGGQLSKADHWYIQQAFGQIVDPGAAPPSGFDASGGVITDYTTPTGTVYRAHIFTNSGEFVVDSTPPPGDPQPNSVDYLIVAGGGSGGAYNGGGGGAGGLLSSHPDIPAPLRGTAVPIDAGTYPIVVGAGAASIHGGGSHGFQGTPSVVNFPSALTATGGGGGGGYSPGIPEAICGGGDGGSGGGASYGASVGEGTAGQGNDGGEGFPGNQYCGGGGGGAGGGGDPGNPGDGDNGWGGLGLQCRIASNPTDISPVGAPGPGGPTTANGWFCGGGGGGRYNTSDDTSGGGPGTAGSSVSGGGYGGAPSGASGGPGGIATGGGGGAGGDGSAISGSGGPGLVVLRYEIATTPSTAKASGGNVSFTPTHTIHAFLTSGEFAAPPTFSETVEYVQVGGGGGGGGSGGSGVAGGGGGGAGNYKTNSTPLSGPFTLSVTVGGGGAGGAGTLERGNPYNPEPGNDGSLSSVNWPSPHGTVNTPGGGGGGKGDSPGESNGDGSGGGGGYPTDPGGPSSGAPFPGTIGATPGYGWARAGGDGNEGSGGGGGATAVGANGPGPDYGGGDGGAGIQVPGTFRWEPTDGEKESLYGAAGPTSAPIPNGFDQSGKWWVAGGGGAGTIWDYSSDNGVGGGGPGPTVPWSGGGSGGPPTGNPEYPTGVDCGGSGVPGTGGGGGGGGRRTTDGPIGPQNYPVDKGSSGGRGGGGLVLIAYPT